MELDLKNKRALVIGGTRGIGGSISSCLSTEGCIVGACGRDLDGVIQMDKMLKQAQPLSCAEQLDASQSDTLKSWIEDISKRFSGLDILIHVVSAQSYSWNLCFSTDLLGCLTAVEAALPFLSQNKNASIVVIASKAALLRVPSYKAYSAIKAALISYASSLSRELAPKGIRVNLVSPGEIYFKGGFWERIKHEDYELYRTALQKNPMGRFGTPEEVARAVVFLASSAASFISGTNLLVDGGSLEHVQF